jgi:Holliday junction resolvasome RuvABC ATP-dependent DNA helicase subunit
MASPRRPGEAVLAGPAGVGKASLGQAIAHELGGRFHELAGDARCPTPGRWPCS